MGNAFTFVPLPVIPWLTAIPIVISLFALLIAHRNYRLGYRRALAEREALKKVSNLSLLIYSARISGEGNYEPPQHFVLDCQLEPNRCVDFPFIVEVENLGQRTASGVGLYIRYPQTLRQWVRPEYNASVPVTINKDEESETVHYEIGDIHPGHKQPLTDHLSINSAALESPINPSSFFLGFKLEQRDATAVGGDISIGIMGQARESRIDTLIRLSKVLPTAELVRPLSLRDKLLDGFFRVADQTKQKGQRMLVGRSIVRVSYDRALVVSDGLVDRVRPDTVVVHCGVRDRRGSLWFPGINARTVYLFHGKSSPEIPGMEGNEVAALGVRQITRFKNQSHPKC